MLIPNIYNGNAHIHNIVNKRSTTEVVRRSTAQNATSSFKLWHIETTETRSLLFWTADGSHCYTCLSYTADHTLDVKRFHFIWFIYIHMGYKNDLQNISSFYTDGNKYSVSRGPLYTNNVQLQQKPFINNNFNVVKYLQREGVGGDSHQHLRSAAWSGVQYDLY